MIGAPNRPVGGDSVALRELRACVTVPSAIRKGPAPLTDRPTTPLLDRVGTPADLRSLSPADLPGLADELRRETISAVSVTGGHLGAGLGVVELTVALHYVFDTPRDRIIWDVGHQAYPHKILTGRRDRIRTLRQPGGISGFTRRAESEYDPFGAAHSSTSISAGLGMAVARDLAGDDQHVIAVIGDGAMSAGMAYEAMNNAGAPEIAADRRPQRQRHVDRAAGRRHVGLSRPPGLRTRLPPLPPPRQAGARLVAELPAATRSSSPKSSPAASGPAAPSSRSSASITSVRSTGTISTTSCRSSRTSATCAAARSWFMSCTKKGKGYAPAEASDDKYHGVAKFDVITGKQAKSGANAPAYTRVFADSLIREARAGRQDRRHHRRHAGRHRPRPLRQGVSRPAPSTSASPSSTRSPSPPGSRRQGYKPFARDLFDLPAARLRPGRPRRRDPEAAGALRHRPRRPRRRRRPDPCRLVRRRLSRLPARLRRHGRRRSRPSWSTWSRPPSPSTTGRRVPLSARRRRRASTCPRSACRSRSAAAGSSAKAPRSRSSPSAPASPNASRRPKELDAYGLPTTVADARFAKPLDTDLIDRLAREHEVLITIEEGAVGGFGAHVLTHLAATGVLERGLQHPHPRHARPLRRAGQAGDDVRSRRPRRPRHRRNRLRRSRPRQRTGGVPPGVRSSGVDVGRNEPRRELCPMKRGRDRATGSLPLKGMIPWEGGRPRPPFSSPQTWRLRFREMAGGDARPPREPRRSRLPMNSSMMSVNAISAERGRDATARPRLHRHSWREAALSTRDNQRAKKWSVC